MKQASERRVPPAVAPRRVYFRIALAVILASLASLSLGCLMLAEVHALSAGNPLAQGDVPGETMMANNAAAGEQVKLTGVYTTRGNAVSCPQLKGADGTMHGVIGLSSDIDLGDRVTVTGRYGISTRCKGRVLIVEAQRKLGD